MKIDYYTADWCKPCQWYKPLVERLASDHGFTLTYIDVTDKMPPGITSIPALFIYDSDGELAYTTVGAYPEDKLTAILENVV